MTDITPPDAQLYIDSIHYKIGLHGFPFMHINGHWIKSNRTADEIKRKIRKQELLEQKYSAKDAAARNTEVNKTGAVPSNAAPLTHKQDAHRYFAVYA